MLKHFKQPTTLLAAGFAVLALSIAAALGVSFGQANDERWVRHTLDVEYRLANLMAHLQDAEAAQRGFLITGDESYLAPYVAVRRSLPGELDALAREVDDNPAQATALSRLRPLVDQRLQSLETGIRLRRTQGSEAAIAYIGQGRGKAIMDEIRRQTQAMRAVESRLLAQRQAQLRATRFGLQAVLVAGFVGLVILTFFAVSDSRRRFAELSRSRDALEAANAQLRAEAEARARAESQVRQMQKMEAIGQLTGGIAHDFNNMLSVVIGSLELARRRLRSEPERAEAYIGNAREGAERAAALTARLLAFSRQQPLAPTPLDPNKLVGGMSELLRRTIGEQMKVETVLAGGIWKVNVDPAQLESAILNLCVNARDALPEGGHLTIETSNAFLDEAYARDHEEVAPGQYVLISVTDTGVGMPREVIDRAFDPFYTTKGVGRGTGLGLSQVFGFVKQSGGHIKIYSEVGRGTTVKVYLPRYSGDGEPAQRPPTVGGAPLAKDHEIVLVVEDDEKVRRVTVDTLRDLGYTVVHAKSGEEALQQLTLHPQVDLLVTDIIMPGMTGRVLADRACEGQPDLKVLFMTGYSRNAVVHNGVLDPGVALLQKPFTAEQLAQKVRDVLDGVGANRPLPSGA